MACAILDWQDSNIYRMDVMRLISDALHFEAMTLIYREWAKAYDDMKLVKDEKNDGSTDWELFHTEKLKNSRARLDKWKALLDEMQRATQA